MANIADGIVVAIDNKIYSVDVVTGKAMTIATVPANVDGVSLSGIPINMLTVNASAGLVYYTKGNEHPQTWNCLLTTMSTTSIC